LAIPILVILAVLWAAVLLPPLFRSRSERRRGNSIRLFSSQLSTISRTGGFPGRSSHSVTVLHPPAGARHPVAGAPSPGSPGPAPRVSSPGPAARRRRRDVISVLAISTLGSVLLAAVAGIPSLWALPALGVLLLGAYLVLLGRITAAAGERRAKVHYLEPRTRARLGRLPASGYALRETASS